MNPQNYNSADYDAEISKNPILKNYLSGGNTVADMEYAISTGDFSTMRNQYGKPFSLREQQQALKQAQKDTEGYYKSIEQKDLADTEANLAQKQADYQKFLLESGQSFEQDKATLDQNAADKGVLFSGGRVQKERNLQRDYNQNQEFNQGTYGRNVGNTLRDYQYKYGEAPTEGLSSYYGVGQNTYNPNVTQGGVKAGPLSQVYNPNKYGFQGTQTAVKSTSANQRAAGLLWNKANKLQASGASNKY